MKRPIKRGRIRRFYFVHSPRGRLVHIAGSITEADRTDCGISMALGWRWARTSAAKKGAARRVCKKCRASAKAAQINVARVRR
jgi:hypothetical protein